MSEIRCIYYLALRRDHLRLSCQHRAETGRECVNHHLPAFHALRCVKKFAMGRTTDKTFDTWIVPHLEERKEEVEELNGVLPRGKKMSRAQEATVKSKLLPRLTKVSERIFLLIGNQ